MIILFLIMMTETAAAFGRPLGSMPTTATRQGNEKGTLTNRCLPISIYEYTP
jgi:hypothetical protein